VAAGPVRQELATRCAGHKYQGRSHRPGGGELHGLAARCACQHALAFTSPALALRASPDTNRLRNSPQGGNPRSASRREPVGRDRPRASAPGLGIKIQGRGLGLNRLNRAASRP
jgi:hypothetical protein